MVLKLLLTRQFRTFLKSHQLLPLFTHMLMVDILVTQPQLAFQVLRLSTLFITYTINPQLKSSMSLNQFPFMLSQLLPVLEDHNASDTSPMVLKLLLTRQFRTFLKSHQLLPLFTHMLMVDILVTQPQLAFQVLRLSTLFITYTINPQLKSSMSLNQFPFMLSQLLHHPLKHQTAPS